MSDIPAARDLLKATIKKLEGRVPAEDLESLRTVHSMMFREKHRPRRSPHKSATVTPEMAEAMRRDAAAHPDKPLTQIASENGVNPGRVSEALAEGDQ